MVTAINMRYVIIQKNTLLDVGLYFIKAYAVNVLLQEQMM